MHSFFPPLWLARRTFVWRTLKSAKKPLKSVLEVGCGEGAVLQVLLEPRSHADCFPPSSLLDSSGRIESIPPPDEKDLRLSRVIGLDIQREVLDQAVQFTSPVAGDKERWTDLTLELYEGSLDVHNDSFEGVHAIIATEVIEHLFPATFKKSAEALLAYKPEIFIVTTPNHEFNSWFVDEESGHRFPDPTGRTDRIFRDADHKFEFTRAEFQDWVNGVLEENDDYEVEMSGVGSLLNYYSGEPIPTLPPSLDDHPALKDEPSSKDGIEDPATFFATQIAVFTRKEGLIDVEERSPRCRRTSMLPFFSPSLSSAQEGSDTFATGSPKSAPSSPARSSIPLVASPATSDSRPLVPSPTRSVRIHSLVSRRIFPALPFPPLQSIEETHRQILALLKLILVGEFNESKISLSRLWNCRSADGAALRLVCEGRISRVLECIIDAEEANEPWAFEVVTTEDHTAEDAVFIEWREFVGTSYEEIRNGETWREEVAQESEGDDAVEELRREPSIAAVTAAWGDEVSIGAPVVAGVAAEHEGNNLAEVAESVW